MTPVAKGSCGEFRSQLYRAVDRTYIRQPEFDELYNLSREVIVMLQKLIDYLETSDYKGPKYKDRSKNDRDKSAEPRSPANNTLNR